MSSQFLLIQSALLRVGNLLSPALSVVQGWIYSGVRETGDFSPIFIVGPPRSGSTVLCQSLTYSMRYLYVDNLSYCFQKNMRFGLWVSLKLHSSRTHASFSSRHGTTTGFRSPSECPGFWLRFFPVVPRRALEEIHISEDVSCTRGVDELRAEVMLPMEKFKNSIIFKNLDNSNRILSLARIFPRAKFVRIKRRPEVVVQSILDARKKIGIPDANWWSVKTFNIDELRLLPLVPRTVGQVYAVESAIESAFGSLGPDQYFTLNYENLSGEYSDLLAFLGNTDKTRDLPLGAIRHPVGIGEKCIEAELLSTVRTYDWKSVGYE